MIDTIYYITYCNVLMINKSIFKMTFFLFINYYFLHFQKQNKKHLMK